MNNQNNDNFSMLLSAKHAAKRFGHSLIELLLVISIIAILMVSSLPNMRSYISKQRAKKEVQQLISAIH